MIAYSCRVADPAGQPLIEVANFLSLDYALSVGGIGVLQLTMPASFDDRLFRLDGRVGVWRSIHGRPPTLDGESMFLIRTWQYTRETTTMTAYHAKSLLQRRILAYYAGTTYTTKNATPAGNLIKALVRENLGVGIVGTDRLGVEKQADLSAWLAIQANKGDGAFGDWAIKFTMRDARDRAGREFATLTLLERLNLRCAPQALYLERFELDFVQFENMKCKANW